MSTQEAMAFIMYALRDISGLFCFFDVFVKADQQAECSVNFFPG
jgi:hypothetical protein